MVVGLGDGRRHQVRLVPKPPVDGGPRDTGLGGYALDGHASVPEPFQLVEGGVEDGWLAASSLGRPARPPSRPVAAERSCDGGQIGRLGRFGGPGGGRCPRRPLGTKSFWRTRAKPRTAPMKDTTDPMTMSSLNVLENRRDRLEQRVTGRRHGDGR